ncbi:conserved membrane hypothetical protein [Paraburkholderia ribeironis]|uniref:Transmembrane protein n=1 Tax=Paraburkholderia ribeironis TaxID=1247936 RepID=A0A1N7S710_9BURK|nr:DUF6622 family protein [Paraburkholderia ribeironis]SIT43217.1 conserved membrane hypothetical protein [Paraburkholderia ribeironis]
MDQLIQQTPKWVFVVFLVLLYLGYVQSKGREVAGSRLIIIPAAMIGLSLFSVGSAFGLSILGFSCWIVGAIFAQLVNISLKQPRGVVYVREKGKFFVPGSLIPLSLMMAIFFAKYFISASLATRFMSPDMPGFVGISSLVLGFLSGTFVARAIFARKAA